MSVFTPTAMAATPYLSLAAVAIAPPFLERVQKTPIPPLFQPFTFMGRSNYNVMLVTMLTMHSYKQHAMGWSPAHALRHSSKVFWHDFFEQHLPEGHRATTLFAVMKDGVLKGEIPEADFVIKPTKGGAGHLLRTMVWNAELHVYRCDDAERSPDERSVYTPEQLAAWIDETYLNAVIEGFEHMRDPFPVGSFRVMTLNVEDRAELIAAVFLPAPEGSHSTASFDLDPHLVDYEKGTVGQPIRPESPGDWVGIDVPELNEVVEACIAMHNELPAHVQISWDVLLTDDGPVYLEGNVFPPGCDYELTVFKDWENFTFLKDRLIESNGSLAGDAPAGVSSIEPTLEAAERVHGALVEAPLDLLEGMGLAEERTQGLRRTSRRILGVLYGGIGDLAEPWTRR